MKLTNPRDYQKINDFEYFTVDVHRFLRKTITREINRACSQAYWRFTDTGEPVNDNLADFAFYALQAEMNKNSAVKK